MKCALLLCWALVGAASAAREAIDNGIASPTIVHQVVETAYEPRCEIHGKKLDLLFILDSSGSLKSKFEDELNVIRRIIDYVAIDAEATRVALVQYSGIQRTEFHFNTFTKKRNVHQAIDTLRHVSGITKTGAAFLYAQQELTPEFGMRGNDVDKIVFLLSDGRTHDYPDDKKYADEMKRKYPVNIWAYGTGDYVAIEELVNITGSRDKVVTNVDLVRLEPLFKEYEGVEICEEMPICIPGSDKPLDLMFILDASDSVEGKFDEEIQFVHRVLNNVHVHPISVRVSLITYSGLPRLDFDFDEYTRDEQIRDYLFKLTALNGTTRTQLALKMAYNVFDEQYGARGPDVNKVALVLTDGHSQYNPVAFARRLVRLKNVTVFAIAVSPTALIDYNELLGITDNHRERVFTRQNLDQFEETFLDFVSMGCPGLDGITVSDTEPFVRGPTEMSCSTNAVVLTVRTEKGFDGYLYAQGFSDHSSCITRGTGETSTQLTLLEGSCGLQKTPAEDGDGYRWNVTVTMQFHPDVITKLDTSLDFYCFAEARVPQSVFDNIVIKNPLKTECHYTVHRFSPDGCVALEGRVGETLHHRWTCDNPPNYGFLVHDCSAIADDDMSIDFVDEDGCATDNNLMSTPHYDTHKYVSKAASVFKFRGKSSVLFRCFISLCDLESEGACKYMIPPDCPDDFGRAKRDTRVPQKKDFVATFMVETRRINILSNEALKPRRQVNFCSVGFA